MNDSWRLVATLVVSLVGAMLGAGVPLLIAGLKFATAWGQLIETVDTLERGHRRLARRVGVVEQRQQREHSPRKVP